VGGVLVRRREVALDQGVRELPLGAGERDAVPLELGRRRAGASELLALEGERRDALLERLDAETTPLAVEAARCNGPQSRSTHPERSIGDDTQMSSPQTGHFPQRRQALG